MKLTISNLDKDIKCVNLIGRLDIQGTGDIETAFTAQTASKKMAVLVDMTEVTFIASIGIRLLVNNAKALQNREGKLVLLSPPSMIKEALEAAGIDLLIPIHDNIEDAVTDLRRAVSPYPSGAPAEW